MGCWHLLCAAEDRGRGEAFTRSTREIVRAPQQGKLLYPLSSASTVELILGFEDLGRSDTSHTRSDGRQSQRRTATSEFARLGDHPDPRNQEYVVCVSLSSPRLLLVYFPSCPFCQTVLSHMLLRTSSVVSCQREPEQWVRWTVCMGEEDEAAHPSHPFTHKRGLLWYLKPSCERRPKREVGEHAAHEELLLLGVSWHPFEIGGSDAMKVA